MRCILYSYVNKLLSPLKNYIYIILCFIALGANAQVSDTTAKKNIADTLKKDLFTAPDTVKHLHSRFASLVPPAALVGYGVSSFYIRPLRRFDTWIYNEAIEHQVVPTSKFENVIQFAPVIMVYGLNLVGVHGKNTFIDRTIIYVMAQGMLNLSLYTLKHTTHRLRPDNSDYLSFPSGHTGNAFSGAEFMAQEYTEKSFVYGLVGYSFATVTGISRISHKDHWFSDVVAGAGFGILSTKAAYLLYPYIRNRLFKAGREKEDNKKITAPDFKKKPTKSMIFLPSYQDGALGMTFSAQL
jgi:membrane-associated phospholipid phosphatase